MELNFLVSPWKLVKWGFASASWMTTGLSNWNLVQNNYFTKYHRLFYLYVKMNNQVKFGNLSGTSAQMLCICTSNCIHS